MFVTKKRYQELWLRHMELTEACFEQEEYISKLGKLLAQEKAKTSHPAGKKPVKKTTVKKTTTKKDK